MSFYFQKKKMYMHKYRDRRQRLEIGKVEREKKKEK